MVKRDNEKVHSLYKNIFMSTPIEKALSAAMNGPTVVDLKVFGHDWNVKKALVSESGDTITVKGTISHNVAYTPDDQISYEFVFQKGKLTKNEVHIDRKGWSAIASKVLSVVTTYVSGAPITPDQIEPLAKKVEDYASGNWEEAGQQLAMRIGLEGYAVKSRTNPAVVGTRVVDHRTH